MRRRNLVLMTLLGSIGCATPLLAARPDVLWQVGGHSRPIHDVALSPGGDLAATASEDGTMKIWNMATGRLVMTLTGSTENFGAAFPMYGVTFSPDGQSVWAATIGGAIEWRLSDGEILRATESMESGGQVFFSPDGQYVGLAGSPAGSEDTVFVYRRSDGQLLKTMEPAGSVAAVFSANSEFVIAGTKMNFLSPAGVIRYYRMSDGGVERTINAHAGPIHWISLSPDGMILASCANDGLAKLWNAADGSLRHTLTGHTSGVTRALFSPDGSRVATTSYDGTVRIWNALTGEPLDVLTPMNGTGIGSMAWLPNGQSLVVAAGAAFGSPIARMQQVSIAGGALIRRFTQFEGVYMDVAVARDGGRVAYAEYDSHLRAINGETGELQWTWPMPGFSDDCLAFTADGSRLAVGRQNGSIVFLDAANGSVMNALNAFSNRVVDIAFSSNGQHMAARGFTDPSKVFAYPSLSLQATIPLAQMLAGGMAFTADGQAVAATSGQGAILFNADTGAVIRAFPGHTFSALDLDIAGDTNLLLTASIDQTAKLWDLTTGATLHTLAPHNSWVQSAAFSPDGLIAATGTIGADRSLRLWNVETGQLLMRYSMDMGTGPKEIAFSSDGGRIICGRTDGALIAIRNPFAFAPGDVNGDGTVDGLDAAALTAALVGQPQTPGDWVRADVNRDGQADGRDFAKFVAIFLGA